MLRYGCTRLEIGVQSVYEDVARDTNRWVLCFYGLLPSLSSSSAGIRISDKPLLSIGPLFIVDIIPLRGHTVKSVTESFHMAKDAGYKIVAHMMPDLVRFESWLLLS